ncbi:unnamed protein product [Chrysodeixis includens]|uniref:Transcription factor Adf-1 n=1 Tax=Chrysodeixis includens TaxID=689277 RepID=A0A9P0BK01_CHRIL|nr:unnamed protein product [Chrysodeixis includens]
MPRKIIFADHVTKRLIKEVKKRECLWNPDHDRYNDRYQMAKNWMEIAENLQQPEERLRAKWKNLRDLFKKEIKKFGPIDSYTGRWRYFEMMKFINRTSGNASKTNDGSDVETKAEINTDEEEFEFEVEDEQEPERNNEVEVYLDEAYEEDPIPDKRAKISDEDYDVMFLKSLAPYFRQLDPIRKLVVRSRMQDMLLNEIAAQTSSNHSQLKNS